jgi:Xaa-Pro aminopeptidase
MDYGFGHGVGWNEIEPPYLIEGDKHVLAAGMVISLGIYMITAKGELIHNREMYEIIPEGSRSLSQVRSWDKLYGVDGFRTTH